VATTFILSPHPDDAVLSLWHLLTGPQEIEVLTIFNGPGSADATLGWWDRVTRAGDALERARERAAEDREALGLAGRSPTDLGFVDGQYRNGDQPVQPLIDAIAAAAPEDALLLAPAALDLHRDHLATRAAALELGRHGRSVALYADVPHATIHGWPAWVTGKQADPYLDPEAFWEVAMNGSGLSLRDLEPQVHALDSGGAAAKRAALERYRTQVPALESLFAVLARPEVLGYEVVWPLPATSTSTPGGTASA
jgi:LmbE family N-acetylglucosaminyl deacetylase